MPDLMINKACMNNNKDILQIGNLKGLTKEDWQEWEKQAAFTDEERATYSDEDLHNMFRNWAFLNKISKLDKDVEEFRSHPKAERDSVYNLMYEKKYGASNTEAPSFDTDFLADSEVDLNQLDSIVDAENVNIKSPSISTQEKTKGSIASTIDSYSNIESQEEADTLSKLGDIPEQAIMSPSKPTANIQVDTLPEEVKESVLLSMGIEEEELESAKNRLKTPEGKAQFSEYLNKVAQPISYEEMDKIARTTPTYSKYADTDRFDSNDKQWWDEVCRIYPMIREVYGVNAASQYLDKKVNENIYNKDTTLNSFGLGFKNANTADLPGYAIETFGFLGGLASGLVYPLLGMDPYTGNSIRKEIETYGLEKADEISHGQVSAREGFNPLKPLQYAWRTAMENPITKYGQNLIGSNSWSKADQAFYEETGVPTNMITQAPDGSFFNKNLLGTLAEQSAGTTWGVLTGLAGGYLFGAANTIRELKDANSLINTLRGLTPLQRKAVFSGEFSGTIEGLSNSIETYFKNKDENELMAKETMIKADPKYKDVWNWAYTQSLALSESPEQAAAAANKAADRYLNYSNPKTYNAVMNQASNEAVVASIKDLTVNSMINGFINTRLTSSVFGRQMGDLMDNAFKKKEFIPFVRVNTKAGAQWEYSKETLALLKALGISIKGGVGEAIEEGSQNISSDTMSGISRSYFNNYLAKIYNPDYNIALGSDIADAFVTSGEAALAGAKAFAKSVVSKETAESALYGALGYFTGNIGVGGTYTQGVKSIQDFALKPGESRLSQLQRNLPITYNLPVLNDIRRGVNSYVNYLDRRDEVNRFWDSKGNTLPSMVGTIGWISQKYDAGSVGDVDAFRFSEQGENVQELLMVNSIQGSSEYNAIIEKLNTLATLDQQSEETQQEAIAEYTKQMNVENTTPEEIVSTIKQNAQHTLDKLGEIKQITYDITREVGNSISKEAMDGLIFSKLLLEEQQSSLNEIESKYKGFSPKDTPVELKVTSEETDDYLRNGSVTASLDRAKEERDKLEAKRQKLVDDIRKGGEREVDESTGEKKKPSKYTEWRNRRKLAAYSKAIDTANKLVSSMEDKTDSRRGAILSESDIMNLDSFRRAYILDPKNRKKYSPEQQSIIENLISQGVAKSPSFIEDMASISNLESNIKNNSDEYSYLLTNSDELDDYIRSIRYQSKVNQAKKEFEGLAEIEDHEEFKKQYNEALSKLGRSGIKRKAFAVATTKRYNKAAKLDHNFELQRKKIDGFLKGTSKYRETQPEERDALQIIVNDILDLAFKESGYNIPFISKISNIKDYVEMYFSPTTDAENNIVETVEEKLKDRRLSVISNIDEIRQQVLNVFDEMSDAQNGVYKGTIAPVDPKVNSADATVAPSQAKGEVAAPPAEESKGEEVSEPIEDRGDAEEPKEGENLESELDLEKFTNLANTDKVALNDFIKKVSTLPEQIRETLIRIINANPQATLKSIKDSLYEEILDIDGREDRKTALTALKEIPASQTNPLLPNDSSTSAEKMEKEPIRENGATLIVSGSNAVIEKEEILEGDSEETKSSKRAFNSRIDIIRQHFNNIKSTNFLLDHKFAKGTHIRFMIDPFLAGEFTSKGVGTKQNAIVAVVEVTDPDEISKYNESLITTKVVDERSGAERETHFMPIGYISVNNSTPFAKRVITAAGNTSSGEIIMNGKVPFFVTSSTKIASSFKQSEYPEGTHYKSTPLGLAILKSSTLPLDSTKSMHDLFQDSKFVDFVKEIIYKIGIREDKNGESIAAFSTTPNGDVKPFSIFKTRVLETLGTKSGMTLKDTLLSTDTQKFAEIVTSGDFRLSPIFDNIQKLFENRNVLSEKNLTEVKDGILSALRKTFYINDNAEFSISLQKDGDIPTSLVLSLGEEPILALGVENLGNKSIAKFGMEDFRDLIKNLSLNKLDTTREISQNNPLLQWQIKYKDIRLNPEGLKDIHLEEVFKNSNEINNILGYIKDGMLTTNHPNLLFDIRELKLSIPGAQYEDMDSYSIFNIPDIPDVPPAQTKDGNGNEVNTITGLPLNPQKKQEVTKVNLSEKEKKIQQALIESTEETEAIETAEDKQHLSPTKGGLTDASVTVLDRRLGIRDESITGEKLSPKTTPVAYKIGSIIDKFVRNLLFNKSIPTTSLIKDQTKKTLADNIYKLLNLSHPNVIWFNTLISKGVRLHTTVDVRGKVKNTLTNEEKDIEAKVNMVGEVDLIGYDEASNTYVITDVKTFSEDHINESLLEGYRYQLYTYKKALAELLVNKGEFSNVEEAEKHIIIDILPIKVEYAKEDSEGRQYEYVDEAPGTSRIAIRRYTLDSNENRIEGSDVVFTEDNMSELLENAAVAPKKKMIDGKPVYSTEKIELVNEKGESIPFDLSLNYSKLPDELKPLVRSSIEGVLDSPSGANDEITELIVDTPAPIQGSTPEGKFENSPITLNNSYPKDLRDNLIAFFNKDSNVTDEELNKLWNALPTYMKESMKCR